MHLGGLFVTGISGPGLCPAIIQALTERGETLATAESCSGGLIAHELTNVPGSSACFLGGIVAYSNAVKVSELSVDPEVLDVHGAVSGEVASMMAEGARARLGSDWAIAVTGIAGPGGGSPDKPVGLVYMAVAGKRATPTRSNRHQFEGSRVVIKQSTANEALKLLWEAVR